MRLGCILIVAAATLLAICEAVSEAAHPSKVSTVSTPNGVQAVDAAVTESAGKRFLRSTKTTELEDSDDDQDDDLDDDSESEDLEDSDDDDEDRWLKLNLSTDLRMRLKNDGTASSVVKGYINADHSVDQVKWLLGITSKTPEDAHKMKIFNLFKEVKAIKDGRRRM